MMLTRTQLLALDPDHRAFTLVGGFMGFFALLEAGVDSAIGEVLGVDGIRKAIVGRNMAFNDKIKTLRTLVHFYVHDAPEKLAFDKLVVRAKKLGEDRNIIAHTPFRRSPTTDGVEFLRTTANSKLEFPEMDWSIDQFIERIGEMNAIDNEIRSFEHRRAIEGVAAALLGNYMPTPQGDQEPGLFGALFTAGQHLRQNDGGENEPNNAASEASD